jgi:hypothetical protein
VSWHDVGLEVQVPYWESRIRREKELLAGQTVADIPRLTLPSSRDEDARRTRSVTLGCALAVALAGTGWTVESLPGAAPVLHRGPDRVEPFSITRDLKDGKLTEPAWQERAAALGIASLGLSAP